MFVVRAWQYRKIREDVWQGQLLLIMYVNNFNHCYMCLWIFKRPLCPHRTVMSALTNGQCLTCLTTVSGRGSSGLQLEFQVTLWITCGVPKLTLQSWMSLVGSSLASRPTLSFLGGFMLNKEWNLALFWHSNYPSSKIASNITRNRNYLMLVCTTKESLQCFQTLSLTEGAVCGQIYNQSLPNFVMNSNLLLCIYYYYFKGQCRTYRWSTSVQMYYYLCLVL